MTSPPTLYTMPLSHYCVCAERQLALKRLPYRAIHVPYHDKRQLLRDTDQDYVPALRWNGRTIAWEEIPSALERAVPSPSLFPDGQEGLARAIDNWAHQVLEERVWRAVVTRVPRRFRDPVERWVFEEMQSRARGPWTLLQRREAEFWGELQPYLTLADGLVRDRPWILGAPSLADCGVYGGLWPLKFVGRSLPREHRHLAAWLRKVERLGGRPTERRGPRRTVK